jgi:hypothetical protein
MNEPDGAALVAEAGARAANRVGHGAQRVFLADDALRELLLEAQELLHLALEHLAHRDARPLRDHAGDVLFGHLFLEVALLGLHLRERGAHGLELLLQLGDLAVVDLRGLAEIAGSLARSSSLRSSSIVGCRSRMSLISSFSRIHWALHRVALALELGDLALHVLDPRLDSACPARA